MPHTGSVLENDIGNSDSFTCHVPTLHPKERVTLFVVVVSGFVDVKVLVQSSLLEYNVFLILCPITKIVVLQRNP